MDQVIKGDLVEPVFKGAKYGWRLAVCVLCLLSLLPLAASAQVHGVPASATSFRNGDVFPRSFGVPASALSLGPNGFNGGFGFNQSFVTSGFNHGFNRFNRRFIQRNRFSQFSNFVPFAVPYYVPFDADYTGEPQPVPPAPQTQLQDGQPARIEITVVDRRTAEPSAEEVRPQQPEKRPAVRPGKSAKPANSSLDSEGPEAQVQPELSPTLLVMRDGTRKDLKNYAIMGDNLFDLSGPGMIAIPLKSVDLDATVAANAKVGKQFRLP